jgi:hypothetical protein
MKVLSTTIIKFPKLRGNVLTATNVLYNGTHDLDDPAVRFMPGAVANEYKDNNYTIFVDKKQYLTLQEDARGNILWHKVALTGISRAAVMIMNDNNVLEGNAWASDTYMVNNQQLAISDPHVLRLLFQKIAAGELVHVLQRMTVMNMNVFGASFRYRIITFNE